jgi:hypothetical protein
VSSAAESLLRWGFENATQKRGSEERENRNIKLEKMNDLKKEAPCTGLQADLRSAQADGNGLRAGYFAFIFHWA